MRIVVDTNILLSGVFFGGFPRKIIQAAANGEIDACSSCEINEEYRLIVDDFQKQSYGHFDKELFSAFLRAVEVVEPTQTVRICRDPDDDKFIECALSAKAFYIVSGDKDLLVLERYKDVEIITAKAFCEQYL